MNRNKVINSLDWISILVYLLLVAIGWLNIYATTHNEEQAAFANFSKEYFKQLIWIGFSLVLMTSILFLDSKFFDAFAFVFYGISIASLILVLGIATEIKGARSWISIGSFSIQPAEFAKFATSLALAKVLSRHGFNITRLKDLLMAASVFMLPAVLVLAQNDAGSAMVYVIFSLVLFREGMSGNYLIAGLLAALYFIFAIIFSELAVYIGVLVLMLSYLLIKKDYIIALITASAFALQTGIWWLLNQTGWLTFSFSTSVMLFAVLLGGYLLLLALVKQAMQYFGIGLFVILSFVYTFSTTTIFNDVLGAHQQTRILVVLGLKSDPLGAEYNVTQSKIAIGAGGITGKGFLKGTQTTFDFVPEQSTDFIFSTVGEEWGFLGTFTVIVLFLFLMIRLLFLAERQRSKFSRIYGYCVASIFFFHFAINIGMAIGILPVIGIPLPFFSYGGSSLWAFTILLFIFIRLDASRMEVL